MKFSQLNLHPQLLKGIENAGFEECTKVQEQVCPVALLHKDIMARSKTGSGKTAVFLISIFEEFLQAKEKNQEFKAMVISPTRELALQITSDAKILASAISEIKIGCFYGGVGYEEQRKLLKDGVDLFIGTPGRLIDYLNSKEIDFKKIKCFVVDEADRMFDMGFYPDVKRLFSVLVDKTQRQTMLFSATLSTRVRNLAWEYMNNPEEIELEPEEIVVNAIDQELYHTSKSEKFALLLKLLKRENPTSVLIFTNTKYMVVDVAQRLKLNGYTVDCLRGDMAQESRLKALKKMKDGKIKVLVATDIAARGLQIDDLPLVINYDIPEDYESYVHRIGRTARAGKKGKAISLACEEFVWGLEAIENYIQMKIPVMYADDLEEVVDLSIGKKIVNHEHLAGVTDKKPKKAPAKKQKTVNKIDYSRLAKMSIEERIAYYKKQNNIVTNDRSPRQSYRNQNMRQSDKPSVKINKQQINKPQLNQINKQQNIKQNNHIKKSKKTGFLGFLKRLFKKKV